MPLAKMFYVDFLGLWVLRCVDMIRARFGLIPSKLIDVLRSVARPQSKTFQFRAAAGNPYQMIDGCGKDWRAH